jgi:hypothetical protein
MIQDRIIKSGKFDWRSAKWLQVEDLKDFYKADREQLIASLKKYGIIRAYRIWEESPGLIWILDGCHLQKELKEQIALGETVPDELHGNWVGCKDRQEAIELIFMYAAVYANITVDGANKQLSLNGLRSDNIKGLGSIPKLNLGTLKMSHEKDIKFTDEDCERQPKRKVCPKCGHEL